MTTDQRPPPQDARRQAARILLDWYAASGVLTAESSTPAGLTNWPDKGFPAAALLQPPKPIARHPAKTQRPAPPAPINSSDAPLPTDEAVQLAQQTAQGASTLMALDKAIKEFDGCPLKPGARSTVVYDGDLSAKVLVIGEGPGRDEDRLGKPFVGRAGQLLDKMLGAIGLARDAGEGQQSVCITNAIYWRPPGNRTPSPAEVAICRPFLEKFIELAQPRLLLLLGNVPTQALFPDAPGITRARGTLRTYKGQSREVPALPLFHPAFLLRQPAQKRLAWADLLLAQETLRSQ